MGVHVETGDDCIAVKGGSNWVVERVVASGTGLTIGSEGHAHNITFRDIVMDRTFGAFMSKPTPQMCCMRTSLSKKHYSFQSGSALHGRSCQGGAHCSSHFFRRHWQTWRANWQTIT